MQGITLNEFLQGVAFTHKFYEQQYKYGQSNEYGTYLVKQGGLMETVDIHTITETSFTVNELVFDTLIDVVVLFADCKIVENQPLTTKEQHNEPSFNHKPTDTMKELTQEEFLQGVAFTHKGTEQLYSSLKYVGRSLYCFLKDLDTPTKHLDYMVKNITEYGFDLQTIFFDSMETKTVLFADCKIVENQPLTTN